MWRGIKMGAPNSDELLFGRFYLRNNLEAFHKFLEQHFPIERNKGLTTALVYGKDVPWWSIAVTTKVDFSRFPKFNNGEPIDVRCVPLGKAKNLNPSKEDLLNAGIVPEGWYPVAYFERAFLMTPTEAKTWFHNRGITSWAEADMVYGVIEYIKPRSITGKFTYQSDLEIQKWLDHYLNGDGTPAPSYRQEQDRKNRVLWKRKGFTPAKYGKYSAEQIENDFCQYEFFRGSTILNATPVPKSKLNQLKKQNTVHAPRERFDKAGQKIYWEFVGDREIGTASLPKLPHQYKIAFEREDSKSKRVRLETAKIKMEMDEIAPHIMYPDWLISRATFPEIGVNGADVLDSLLLGARTEQGTIYAIKRNAPTKTLHKQILGNGITGGLRGIHLHRWLDREYPKTKIKYNNIPVTGLPVTLISGADILDFLIAKTLSSKIPTQYLI